MPLEFENNKWPIHDSFSVLKINEDEYCISFEAFSDIFVAERNGKLKRIKIDFKKYNLNNKVESFPNLNDQYEAHLNRKYAFGSQKFSPLKYNETSNISRGLQAYSNDEDELLFDINWNRNSLQIYDVASGESIKEISFQTEGDEAVGRVFGFHVQSLDSIFLFSQQVAEIVLIDSANTIKDRISYETPDEYSNAFVHNAYFISRPILHDNKLIVKTHLQGNYKDMTAEKLQKKSISYSIDIESGAAELLNPKYPADYLNRGLKFYEYSMASNTDQLVFSFFGDHRLFYSSKNTGNTLKSKMVKSRYLADELPLFPINGARESSYKYLFASDHYESLLYDNYRNIYYRFCFPAQEYNNMEELSTLKETPNSFSIFI